MLPIFIQKILLAVVAAFVLASCTTQDEILMESEESIFIEEPISIEAIPQEFDHVWSDKEKAIIKAMYASTKYSDDIWKHIAYNILGTNQKNNPIVKHFDCEYGCYLVLEKSEIPPETRILVQVGVFPFSPRYYLLETRKETEYSHDLEKDSLPVATFPRKANIGSLCGDDTVCSPIFLDEYGTFVAMREDYPNATYLTQQTPFDVWKPNKK